MIGLIESKQSYYMFARTPGARDKQKRKRRNLIAEGSAVGAVGLAGINRGIKRELPNAEAVARVSRRDASEAVENLRATKDSIGSAKSRLDDFNTMQKITSPEHHLQGRIKQSVDQAQRDISEGTSKLKGLQDNVGKTAKDAISREKALRNIKIGKRVSKYGAIGLAGLAGGELIRRGINKARQYEIRRK
jgi:hypothetical protein